ncbi:unnamed protein product [Brachionus calyciflorus]|uniref:Ion transport domain-containing protein n=1 Tax=Brachionus calyciflorus TaxID=104777 RepID=A0A813NGV0_9BILA|nr:unnamed protein product [Brachionus calyciflorus]
MDPESQNSNDSNNKKKSSCFLDCLPCFRNSDKKISIQDEQVDEIFECLKKNLKEKSQVEYEKFQLKLANADFKTNETDEVVLHLVAELKSLEKIVNLYSGLIDEEPFKENRGTSVLHLAALSDNDFLIKHLLEKENANLEEGDKKKQTPLHCAAKVGANNAILCLIENGADKEARDYLGRTPLYLAAEYGQEEIVKLLLEKGCEVNVKNINGQKALYWIIAKCRNLAVEILDNYRTIDKYYYKETYNLKSVDLELTDTTNEVPSVKSILELIVEQYDSELISHPVIKKLIQYKWNNYCCFWPVIKFIFDLLFCVAWNLWSVLIPYHERHIYNLPQENWRIILFVFGILGVIIIITFEITEGIWEYTHKKEIRKTRLSEIEKEKKAYPCTETQTLIENEENLNQGFCEKLKKKISKLFKSSKENDKNSYTEKNFVKSFDGWLIIDILAIILLITSLATHLADIVDHNETISRDHIRVASITVIVLSFRLLKTARTLWMPFGMLVMTLYHIVMDIIVWILAFITIWIPFTTCFYMLFGNGLTIDCDSATQTCSAENKTVISGMEDYNKAAFFLFTAALGAGDIPYEQFNELDDKISNFIVGVYIGLTALIMVNIFIALLSSTFERVHDFSKGVFLIERAKKIIQVERFSKRIRANRLGQTPSKYYAEYNPKDCRDDIGPKKDLDPVNNLIQNIKKDLIVNFTNIENKYSKQSLQINQSFNTLKAEFQKTTKNKKVNQLEGKSQVKVSYVENIEDETEN